MKEVKTIDEMWQEHLSGRDNPTQDEITKQVKETLYTEHEYESQEKTNYAMYKEIALLFDNIELTFDNVNKIFELENRTETDLKNLKEFIFCITLMYGQDILKAQVKNSKEQEKSEIDKHKKRCELMAIIIQAIDSVIVTID